MLQSRQLSDILWPASAPVGTAMTLDICVQNDLLSVEITSNNCLSLVHNDTVTPVSRISCPSSKVQS